LPVRFLDARPLKLTTADDQCRRREREVGNWHPSADGNLLGHRCRLDTPVIGNRQDDVIRSGQGELSHSAGRSVRRRRSRVGRLARLSLSTASVNRMLSPSRAVLGEKEEVRDRRPVRQQDRPASSIEAVRARVPRRNSTHGVTEMT
jgi:hypothetical protein